MSKQTNVLIVTIFVVALFLALFSGSFLFAIVQGESTHYVTVSGQKVGVSAQFGKSEWAPGKSTADNCFLEITDFSIDGTQADVEAREYGKICAWDMYGIPYIKANVPDLDLSKYEKVVIHRSVSLQACSENRYATITSSLFGEKEVEFTKSLSLGIDCQNAALGDIIVSNDGYSITVNAPEGRYIYDASKSLYFKNIVSAGATFDDPATANIRYKITGIEITEKPGIPSSDASSGNLFDDLFGGGDNSNSGSNDSGGIFDNWFGGGDTVDSPSDQVSNPSTNGDLVDVPQDTVSNANESVSWLQTFWQWVKGLFTR